MAILVHNYADTSFKEPIMKTGLEILINHDRLNQTMDEKGLAAVVARAGINLTYLAGFAYPGTLARHVDLADSPRGVFLVWPRKGEPRMVVNTIAEDLVRRDSWVEQLDVYEGYVEPPIERLAKTLREMGLAAETVGFEENFISARDWQALQSGLPKLRLVDSTEAMDRVRAIKTPGEIKLIRESADILDNAFLAAFPTVRPGQRERDLHARIVAECIVGGCEWAHGILNSERNTVSYGGESDFVFKAGDAIRTDYVAYRKGYPGHQSRCAVVGKPSAEQLQRYRVIRNIYRASIEECRPGRTADEVYAAVQSHFRKEGLEFRHMLAGHSVGAWWHQQEPVISRGNARRLEVGMVIAMEPHIDHWHIQDMVLIRPQGPELLTPKFSTDEPFACR
jgi:Xaa-Pro aminopeptidase